MSSLQGLHSKHSIAEIFAFSLTKCSMSESMKTDYRVSLDEATHLSPKEIVERVVFRVREDSPSYINWQEMEPFLDSLDPTVAEAFCAWMSLGYVAIGGIWMIYEAFCARMVYLAIAGLRRMGEEHAAKVLDITTQIFPDGKIPDDAHEFLIEEEELWAEFVAKHEPLAFDAERPLDDFFSCEEFLKRHRDSFIISE